MDFLDITALKRRYAQFRFNGKARSRIYRKVSSFIRNGVSLPDTLRVLYRFATDDGKRPGEPMAVVLKDWIDRTNNGRSFGRAVMDWVPPGDRIVIEAGESAGGLADALDNALFIHESGKKIRSAIVAGIAYPSFLVLLAIGLLVIFGTRIVPSFETVLPRERWTGTAADMASVADFVHYGLVPVVLVALCTIGVMIWSMPRWTGPTRVKADRMVPWSIYRLNMGAGFMLSVSALVKAGVHMPEILRMLGRGAPPWYYERMSEALKYVNNGQNLGEALHKTGMNFPDRDTVQDLRAYAGFDNFDETLELLGRQWVEESVDRIRAQMAIIRNISLLVLGAVFATIATGIFALQQQVTSSL